MYKVPKVNDQMLYNHMQLFFIKIHLKDCIRNGDTREKNEIVAEWINSNSAMFRNQWCKYQKVI